EPKTRSALDPLSPRFVLTHDSLPSGVARFRAAHWTFAPRDLARRAAAGDGGPAGHLRVYRHDSGPVMLGPQRIVCLLREEIGDADAAALLPRHGLSHARRLAFARHLYALQVPHDVHPFDAAGELAAHRDCVYAEPEMVEPLRRRSDAVGDPGFPRQWH